MEKCLGRDILYLFMGAIQAFFSYACLKLNKGILMMAIKLVGQSIELDYTE